MKLYKVLNKDGSCANGGVGKWPLPHDGRPGDWLEVTGVLVPCENGLHLCRPKDLVRWLSTIALYEAEHTGDYIDVDGLNGNRVCQRARLLWRVDTWNEHTGRLFACDCAEHVVPIYESYTPGDQRPRQAVTVARRFANGEASIAELAAAGTAARAAARDAGGDTAGDAAWAAAWAAAYAAGGDTAGDAAWDAAYAAGTAARAAASAAGGDTGGEWRGGCAEWWWQTERLMQYLDGTLPPKEEAT